MWHTYITNERADNECVEDDAADQNTFFDHDMFELIKYISIINQHLYKLVENTISFQNFLDVLIDVAVYLLQKHSLYILT